MCKEYRDSNSIKLNTFSNNQILEIEDINSVMANWLDPQIMLLCGKNTGGKVDWGDDGVLKMGNNPNFTLQLNYPTKLKLTLINDTFSLYVNDILQQSVSVYTNQWLVYTGVQIAAPNSRMLVTGFRYKNFE